MAHLTYRLMASEGVLKYVLWSVPECAEDYVLLHRHIVRVQYADNKLYSISNRRPRPENDRLGTCRGREIAVQGRDSFSASLRAISLISRRARRVM